MIIYKHTIPTVREVIDFGYRLVKTYLLFVVMFLRNTIPTWIYMYIDTLLLTIPDCLRLLCGRFRASNIEQCKRPNELLILYEYEGCPFCKKVREALNVLDLDYIVYPCPRETLINYGVSINSRFRGEVKQLGGSLCFPFFVDPNTKTRMNESNDIIDYLWRTYGHCATPPLTYKIANKRPFQVFSLILASLFRPCLDNGYVRVPSKRPEKNLELWGYEASGFVKRVREILSSLEIPYVMHVMPFGANEKREQFAKLHENELSPLRKRLGLVQVPYLMDPNTNTQMFGSADIVSYLKTTYQIGPIPSETWMDLSTTSSVK